MELEEQKEKWRKEQLLIASQVVILPDSSPSEGRFQSIPLNDNNNDNNDSPSFYGGVDVSFPTDDEDPSVAVYVIVEHSSGKVVYQDSMYFTLQMPYIPSYLAFREIGPLETLIQKQLQNQPEFTPKAILVDGNGIFHPRRAGIACFVGVKTGIPTIGVGKTLFYEGKLNKELVLEQLNESLSDAKSALIDNNPDSQTTTGNDVLIMDSQPIPRTNNLPSNGDLPDRGILVQELSSICRGIAVPLVNEENEVLACALVGHGGRTRTGCKQPSPGTKNPIYISIGHNMSLQDSVRIVASLSIAKIPEPVRQADLMGREMLRQKEQKQTS